MRLLLPSFARALLARGPCAVASVALALLLVLAPSLAQSAPAPRGPAALAEAKRLHDEVNDLVTNKGRYDEALPLAERALHIREANLRRSDLRVAESLRDMADVHAYRGDFKMAEPLYLRALAIVEEARGEHRIRLLRLLDDLGTLYVNMQRLDEAEAFFRRARETLETMTDSSREAKELAVDTWNNIASLSYFKGEHKQAESVFRRALEAAEKLGPDDPKVALVAGNLAALYDRLGRYGESEPLHLRALAIYEKKYGPEHPKVATTLNNLGVVASEQGDPVRATELHERVLAIREKLLGPDHPDVGVSLTNLASAYKDRGDRERAKKLFARALEVLEKRLGPDHPKTLQVLHNYTALLVRMNAPEAAGHLARLAKAQRNKDPKVFDIRAIDTSLWIAQLALLIDMHADARELAQRVLEAVEGKLGKNSTRAAQCLAVIAESYEREGNLRTALDVYSQVIEMAEKTYGPKHDQLARMLMEYAAACASGGDLKKAVDLMARAADIDEGNMRTILGAGSESQKKAYVSAAAAYADKIVSLHADRGPKDPGAARLAMLAILRRKGRVLDALVDGVGALRRRLAPEDVALFDELAVLRGIVAKTLVKNVSSPAEQLIQEAAEKRIEEIEQEISRRSAEFRASEAPITIEAVQAAIPEGAALVEIFLLHPRAKNETPAARYTAYVLGRTGHPQWVDLGEATSIDAGVRAAREAFSDSSRKDARALARALDEQVMRPIRRLLGDTRRILLSPDGSLNLIPVGALVDEHQRFLTQDYSISYLVSGRDLLRMQSRPPARAGDTVLANPDFGVACAAAEASGEQGGTRAGPRLSRAVFSPLPGTAEEATALRAILPQSTVLTGEAATENTLRSLHGPRLLHIATHGFFLDSAQNAASTSRGLVLDAVDPAGETTRQPNPLLFSGLALAGANTHGCQVDDGLLTALEASTLDLWGTKLVVLSACETGLGKLEQGEGVSGLRRALFTAGAESAIMSLWKVDDEATRDLMIATYARLAKGGGRAESLRQAQLAMLQGGKLAHPYYWASFVPIGDYRTLEGKAPVVEIEPAPGRIAPAARGCACHVPAAQEADPRLWAIVVAMGAAVGTRSARKRRLRMRAPGSNLC